MAIEMDGLGNWQVGGPNGQPDRLVAYRFRATTSSALASIQVAFPNMNPGYAAGTGGTLEISLRSDDGTAGHFPSGAILAKTSIRPGEIIPTTNWPRIAFPTPAQLTAGTLYHIVFRNTDPDPAANFVSVDDIHLNPPFGSPIQPKYANVDWALVYRPTAGADWLYQTDYAPILGLHYANGHVAGTAYVYSDLGSPRTISGSAKVRETFTVSGADRTVSSVGVRLKWISGTSPLTVRLETSGGSEIETVTIPAGALTTSGYAVRATAAFAAPRTLAAGQTYHLVLSSSGSYRAFAPYEGSAYGKWDPRTYFADGHAQYTTGAGWLDWGGRTDHDLQFYLE